MFPLTHLWPVIYIRRNQAVGFYYQNMWIKVQVINMYIYWKCHSSAVVFHTFWQKPTTRFSHVERGCRQVNWGASSEKVGFVFLCLVVLAILQLSWNCVIINLLHASVPFFYPLKTPERKVLSTWGWNGLKLHGFIASHWYFWFFFTLIFSEIFVEKKFRAFVLRIVKLDVPLILSSFQEKI